MTTAYLEIQIREVIASNVIYFNFKFVILPKNINKGTKRRSSYKEHIEDALALNADEGRDQLR